jgi:exopolysaccharide biosynthesis polyprenyl glycosylphosphotransferase
MEEMMPTATERELTSLTVSANPGDKFVRPEVKEGQRFLTPVRRNGYNLWKRGLDVAVSGTMLLVFFPVMLVTALAIRFTDPGPVFYKSRRIGRGGKPFHVLKFRTMYTDADKRVAELWALNKHEGPVFKIENDPRITKIGHFLRRYSIDELPQFINVFKGEMSLVGPRPLHEYETEKFDDYAMERLIIKPGITCYWQIMGRSNLTFEEWMELDHKYIEEMSMWTDLKILIKTPAAVLKSEGAY